MSVLFTGVCESLVDIASTPIVGRKRESVPFVRIGDLAIAPVEILHIPTPGFNGRLGVKRITLAPFVPGRTKKLHEPHRPNRRERSGVQAGFCDSLSFDALPIKTIPSGVVLEDAVVAIHGVQPTHLPTTIQARATPIRSATKSAHSGMPRLMIPSQYHSLSAPMTTAMSAAHPTGIKTVPATTRAKL